MHIDVNQHLGTSPLYHSLRRSRKHGSVTTWVPALRHTIMCSIYSHCYARWQSCYGALYKVPTIKRNMIDMWAIWPSVDFPFLTSAEWGGSPPIGFGNFSHGCLGRKPALKDMMCRCIQMCIEQILYIYIYGTGYNIYIYVCVCVFVYVVCMCMDCLLVYVCIYIQCVYIYI